MSEDELCVHVFTEIDTSVLLIRTFVVMIHRDIWVTGNKNNNMDWSLVRNAGEASLLLAESLAYIVKCTTFMYAAS